MSFKRELIAFAVRILATKTTLVRQPEPFEALINNLFGYESYDQQIARNIEVELDRATRTVKNVRRNREFKKITEAF